LLAALSALAAPALRAQAAWPTRPIMLVVPFAPGGIADIVARTVAEAMTGPLGQPIVVENRPGAGSIAASTQVAGSAPDGHTLLLMSNANAVSVSLFRKLPYDPVRDFAPVSTLGFFDLGLFTGAASRFGTLKEVLSFARANPGKLTIGSIAVGSTQHLAAELFKTRAGIDALVVPYKGAGAVLAALRGGEVDIAIEILGPVLAQVHAKAIRALAVTSERRFLALPEVPTVIESGVPGYAVASWNALAAPKGTPAAVIARLQRAVHDAIGQPAVRSKLEALGVRAQAGSPEALARLLAGEISRWGGVIRAAKIELQ
jgi:tripartite-type tricarboxylate transporter receptor subunit TctC